MKILLLLLLLVLQVRQFNEQGAQPEKPICIYS
jgi:hypothetical protein